ncbi:MAG: DUF881 domain-containing protein [Clostridia bacterium]|nr:DUF881 domain-containing protein [Clostridia bacterium]
MMYDKTDIKKSKTAFLTIICVILGMLISLNITDMNITTSRSDMITVERTQEILGEINSLKAENEKYLNQIKDYQTQIDNLQLKASKVNKGTEAIHKELQQAKIVAGLADVEGPGIELILSDAERELFPGENASNLIVHDSDLINIINELKSAGAEAVSINGQRVIYNTKIRCGGPIIIVNNYRFAPPYVIRAIGDVERMEKRLKQESGLYDAFIFYGLKINLKRVDNMRIDKFDRDFNFKYAKPVMEEGE